MDKKAVISFTVFMLLCSTSLDSFAAVKTDSQSTNMQIMPGEVYTAMQRLADQGIVKLPAGCRSVRDAYFDRHEMTLLTLQAMKRIGMDANGLVNGQKKENLDGYVDTLPFGCFRREDDCDGRGGYFEGGRGARGVPEQGRADAAEAECEYIGD